MRSDTSNSPASEPRQPRFELFGFELAQVAEHPDVHAQQRNRRRVDELHRVQHRAVAAERDREIEIRARTRRRRAAYASSPAAGESGAGTRTSTPCATSHAALRFASSCATRSVAVRHDADAARRRGHGCSASVSCACCTASSSAAVGDRRPAAARVHEELDVAVGAAQRRRHDGGDTQPAVVEPGHDLAQHRRVHLGVAHDAAPSDPGPARLVLRLHEQHEVGGVGRQASAGSARRCAAR